MSTNIGENIVKYRKLNGVSQKYLASLLGVSAQGLLKIEKGKVSPRAKVLEKLIDVLSITPNQLFGVEQISEEKDCIWRTESKAKSETKTRV
jgi:Predicted transcriptional regulators